MDKSLEVIMVAVMLVIAVVVLVSILQDSSSDVGDFQSDASNTVSCKVLMQRYESVLECDGSLREPEQDPTPTRIVEEAHEEGCAWADPINHRDAAQRVCN